MENIESYDIHPLTSEWTFWVIQIKRIGDSVQYEIEPIITFGTIEAFWNAFAQFPIVTDLKQGGIALFKSGIKPAWEDPKNIDGFAVMMLIDNPTKEQWERIVTKTIGGEFEEKLRGKAPKFCGFIAQPKNGAVSFDIWLEKGEIQNELKENIQNVFNIEPKTYRTKRHPKVH